MTQELKSDLLALECEGNIAKLPQTQLNDYASLKRLLIQANGKYKRNSFEFPYSAQAIINRLSSGDIINFKKEFQFFPTPEEMADKMVDQIIWNGGYTKNILEPSAGHGALIEAIRRVSDVPCIHAVELSALNFEVLKEKFENQRGKGVRLFKGDFLNMGELCPPYDIIIANPPFSKNQDIDHVLRMWELLADGGQLISIMSSSWLHGQQKKQSEFREFVEAHGLYMRNGQGAFKTSGTMVDSVLVVLNK